MNLKKKYIFTYEELNSLLQDAYKLKCDGFHIDETHNLICNIKEVE